MNLEDQTTINLQLLEQVRKGNLPGIRFLIIDLLADIDFVDHCGNSALSLAVSCRAMDQIADFAAMDPDLPDVPRSSTKSLTPAEQVNMVKMLLDLGADPSLLSPILETFTFGFESTDGIVRALVSAGCDVNVNLEHVGTPLLGVFVIDDQKTAVSLAQLLITNGARVDEKNNRGESPLDYALKFRGKRPLAKCLLRAGASMTDLPDDLEENREPPVPVYCRVKNDLVWRPAEIPPAKKFVAQVLKRGGWKKYALWHKRVLAGLVSKCSKRVDLSDDAAGLVVDFYCPSGGA